MTDEECDALIALKEAVKPFAYAKPIPSTIPPDQVLFRFGDWTVYLRDLLKLRQAFFKVETL